MKRSFKDYLLTFCFSLVVFTLAAVFVIHAAEGLMGDVVVKIGSSASSNPVEEEKVPTVTNKGEADGGEKVTQEDKTVTFLLMGLDYNQKNADAIFLVGINATKGQSAVALIPSNTVVPEGSVKHKLGELYSSRTMNFFKDFIQQETGVMPDYYAAMPMSAVSNLIDFLGGINYNVPQDMYYFDPTQNLKINLKAGEQTLTGDKAIQLLAYRSYGDANRQQTQLSFVKKFCTTFFVADNLSRAGAIVNNMYYNCQTDFDEAALGAVGTMIFNFTTYSQTYIQIPGAASGSYYAISTSRAKSMFKIYQ